MTEFSTIFGRWITVLLVAAIITDAWKSAGRLVLDLVAALVFYRLVRGDG